MDELPDDDGLRAVAAQLGLTADGILGHGGEAWVFAFGDDEVARIHHGSVVEAVVRDRAALLAEIATTDLAFATPTVNRVERIEDRWVTFEPRLEGSDLLPQLEHLGPEIIDAHLDAAASIHHIPTRRGWWGDLLGADPIRRSTYRAWAIAKATHSLQLAGPAFAGVDPEQLVAALPEPDRPVLVHSDAFTGNMLSDGTRITAVVDFGVCSAIGDERTDPIAAVAYLHPNITATATDAHRARGQEWLERHGLLELYEPVRRWLAAGWAGAVDDLDLHEWCREVLLG